MPWRSGPASAAGLVLHGPLVRSRRQREPPGGEFAGSSSLLWVDAGRRGGRPSGNKYTHSSPDLGQHRTAYTRKRRWRGPGLVRCPASRRCWSRKHPSHCHCRGHGQSCSHGRAWSSTPTLEDTRCVQGLSKVPLYWRCQKLLLGQWILSRGACSMHFSWSCLTANIMFTVFLPGLKPHCASGRVCSVTVMSLLRMTRAKIFPATERRKIPL